MCPHATTTTVAFLYGEDESGSELGHAAHVAECPDCAAVVEEHAAVVSAIAPVLPALRTAGPVGREVHRPVERGRTLRRAAWVHRGLWVAAAVAAAAVGLVAIGLGGVGWPSVEPATAPAVAGPLPADTFDAALDDLDLEVASLELELL